MRITLKKNIIYIAIAIVTLAIGLGFYSYKKLHKPKKINSTAINTEVVSLDDQQSITTTYKNTPEKGLILFLVDDNDRSLNKQLANQFAELSYYVATIPLQSLSALSEKNGECINLADKLLDTANALQSHFDIDSDDLPILVGANKGALGVYIALSQSEKHSFHAAISINFDSQIDTRYQFCQTDNFKIKTENNKQTVMPIKHLPSSWYLFQNNDNASINDFTKKMGNAKLTIANTKNQTSASEAIQILQWLDPRLADQISSDNSDGDLPIIEVTADNASNNANRTDTMAILLTGDGGWAEIDKNVAKFLSEKGIPTVALDSLSYFWKKRTAEETAKDIEITAHEYLEKWQKKKIILVGYSFGADVLPFIANKLSPEIQQKISLVALLGMGTTAAFEFHLSSWMNSDKDPSRMPLLPELTKLKWINSICIYGQDDIEANCLPATALGVKAIKMPGDHHFDKKYEQLADHIIENAK